MRHVRILGSVDTALRAALREPHPFATERAAFLMGRSDGADLVLLSSFLPLEDDDYDPDDTVGARINAKAISRALSCASQRKLSTFHVHLHPHRGMPRLSETDLTQLPAVMQPFSYVVPDQPRGIIVLSLDAYTALIWYPAHRGPVTVRNFTVVGRPMRVLRGMS
jgi:hypothetical protein